MKKKMNIWKKLLGVVLILPVVLVLVAVMIFVGNLIDWRYILVAIAVILGGLTIALMFRKGISLLFNKEDKK